MRMPKVLLDGFEGLEMRGRIEVGADGLQRIERHVGADVVHDKAAHRARRLRSEHEAEQAAHGGANPVHLAKSEMRDEGVDVGEELREMILVRRGEPVAFAASGDVDADDPRVGRECCSQRVEVSRVTAVAVGADDRACTAAFAPVGVMQPVMARGAYRLVVPVPRTRNVRRFESIPVDGAFQEQVGFTGFLLAGLDGGIHRRADGLQAAQGTVNQPGEEIGQVHRTLGVGVPHMLFYGRVFGVTGLEVHSNLLVEDCGTRNMQKIPLEIGAVDKI